MQGSRGVHRFTTVYDADNTRITAKSEGIAHLDLRKNRDRPSNTTVCFGSCNVGLEDVLQRLEGKPSAAAQHPTLHDGREKGLDSVLEVQEEAKADKARGQAHWGCTRCRRPPGEAELL